jgi:cysteine desulfurase
VSADVAAPAGLQGGPVYLDYNATTPVDPRVVEAMLPYLTTHFGNPSSGHHYAQEPRRALATARQQVAALIGAATDEIVFTGSGSEANTLAIHGSVMAHRRPSDIQVITQVTEHPAVLEACRTLHRRHGTEVTYLPVRSDGRVRPQELAEALTSRTALVSIMAANNETGVLQPLDELARLTHKHGALFHTDAAQAVGKIPIDVGRLGVDLLSVVGHKMYAPKGVGALYVRSGVLLEPLVLGGGQERGLRAGTESVALAVGLGTAADLARRELADDGPRRLQELRDLLYRRLNDLLPGRVRLTGHATLRLPGTLHVGIIGVRGDDLLAATPAIAAATGSACHARSQEPSPVMLAMPHDRGEALSALRLSLGRWTTRPEVERAAEAIATTAHHLLARAAARPRPEAATGLSADPVGGGPVVR